MIGSRTPSLVAAAALASLALLSTACGGSGSGISVTSSGPVKAPASSSGRERDGTRCTPSSSLRRNDATIRSDRDAGTHSGDDTDTADPRDTGDEESTDSDRTVPRFGGDEILDCLGSSIAFITTEFGSGTGVVVEGGYVVTSAHVVDPFPTVEITFEGGEHHDDVPVVGIDPLADIALLGPIDTERAGITLDDPADIRKGDDVYLVGYPGEIDDEPELTISKGVLSRQRVADPFDLHFVQTDAAIGEGQSGGALVDASGRAVGISGMHYNEFAYVLSGVDVNASIEAIIAGSIPAYRTIPTEGTHTTSTMRIDDPEFDHGWLVVPSAPTARTITFEMTVVPDHGAAQPATAPAFSATDFYEGTGIYANDVVLAASADALDLTLDEVREHFEDGATEGASGREVAPGRFEIEVPADVTVSIDFGADGAGNASLTSSEPFGALIDASNHDAPAAIAIGDEVEGVVSTIGASMEYEITLAAGDTIHLFAGSPTGDVSLTVQAPGEPVFDSVHYDDSDAGLFGTDVDEDFRASVDGTYTIIVDEVNGMTTGYRLAVSAA